MAAVWALFLVMAAGAPAARPVHLYPQAPPPPPGYLAPAPPPFPRPWPPAWLVVDPNRKPPREGQRGHSLRVHGSRGCRGRR
jgi:hypothetical protein